MSSEHQIEVGLLVCFFACGLLVESADSPRRWRRWGGQAVGGLVFAFVFGLAVLPPVLVVLGLT